MYSSAIRVCQLSHHTNEDKPRLVLLILAVNSQNPPSLGVWWKNSQCHIRSNMPEMDGCWTQQSWAKIRCICSIRDISLEIFAILYFSAMFAGVHTDVCILHGVCLLQHHDQPEFMFGEDMIGGVTQATIERNTYPHKYKRVQRTSTCQVCVHSLLVLLLMSIHISHTAVCNLFSVCHCLLQLFHILLCFGKQKGMPCVTSPNVLQVRNWRACSYSAAAVSLPLSRWQHSTLLCTSNLK